MFSNPFLSIPSVVITFAVLVITLTLPTVTVAQQGHDEPCNNLTGPFCTDDLGLICSPSTMLCECRQGSVYNPTNLTCNTYVGQPCDRGDGGIPCVEHADCFWDNDLLEETCQCTHQYSDGHNGFCLGSEGGFCDTNDDCNLQELLVCSAGTCRCPNPTNQMLDGKCVNTVGSFCTQDPEGIQCARNSTCSPDPNSITNFSCQCNQGYVPNMSRDQCLLGFGEPCTDIWNDHECAEEFGLSCKQGQCQCKYAPSQEWDEGGKFCGGVAGSKCSILLELDGASDSALWFCKSGLQCLNSSPYHSAVGVCTPIIKS